MAPQPLTAFTSYLAERSTEFDSDDLIKRFPTVLVDAVRRFTEPSLDEHSIIEARNLEERGAYVPPRSLTAGILVVFSLLGASLGLLVLWLFVRKGGFIWKETDWEDYKSSVLRRPGERPDDAITVFSDGSTRRAGGSSQGARTVVLGELDTTYTKSRVPKTFGPRPMVSKKRTGMASVWGAGESIWGRLRGGERGNDADTVVAREKEMRDDRSIRSESYVDRQEPARPRGWKPEDSDLSSHYPNLNHNPTVVRHPSKAAKRGKSTRHSTRKPAQPPPPPKRVISPQSTEYSSSDDSSSDSDSDSDDDVSSIDQSQLGMAKGHKVYTHHLPQEKMTAGKNAGPVERNGGGAGGTFGSGVPVGHLVPIGSRAVVPGGSRGYRKGSEGSLSSEGSMASSHI